ncbi:WXG100 family type VII secretion target [Streptomyces sp. NPDC048297]|uniref:WXG100 family type VII secretion target n=1 Tax=Streptomyces sp. NPDC048297 TaxID=3365531 RepID=UPI00371BD85F
MATYSVQLEEVAFIAGEMETITAAVTATKNDLDNQAAMRLSEWTGAAVEAYKEQQKIWDGAADKMSELSLAMTKALQEIQQYYAEGEATGTALWAGR